MRPGPAARQTDLQGAPAACYVLQARMCSACSSSCSQATRSKPARLSQYGPSNGPARNNSSPGMRARSSCRADRMSRISARISSTAQSRRSATSCALKLSTSWTEEKSRCRPARMPSMADRSQADQPLRWARISLIVYAPATGSVVICIPSRPSIAANKSARALVRRSSSSPLSIPPSCPGSGMCRMRASPACDSCSSQGEPPRLNQEP